MFSWIPNDHAYTILLILCFLTTLHDIFNYRIDTVVLWVTSPRCTNVQVEQTASTSQYSRVKLLVPTYSGVHKSQAPGHPGD